MDFEKLRPQIFAIGAIYRAVTDICPEANIPEPDMRPLRAFTQAITRMHQNKKCTKGLEELIALYAKKIEIADWENLFNAPVPMEYRNDFWSGFYSLGNKISAQRKKSGLTQLELAKAIGSNRVEISRWENGTVKPTMQTLERIATVCKCTVDDLI